MEVADSSETLLPTETTERHIHDDHNPNIQSHEPQTSHSSLFIVSAVYATSTQTFRQACTHAMMAPISGSNYFGQHWPVLFVVCRAAQTSGRRPTASPAAPSYLQVSGATIKSSLLA
jgi:hypothetical protein